MNEAELAAGLAPTPNYRYADVLGDRMFVAGQVPMDGSGELVGEGDVGVQAERCLTNLFLLLETHHFVPDDIHHLTVYVVGPHANLQGAWAAIDRRFDSNVPPATLLGVQCLGYASQLVEVDARIERARCP
jgi:enamine deaminase RidA (YjgF/YER057c/UK114 family)